MKLYTLGKVAKITELSKERVRQIAAELGLGRPVEGVRINFKTRVYTNKDVGAIKARIDRRRKKRRWSEWDNGY